MAESYNIHYPMNSFFSDIIICGGGIHQWDKSQHSSTPKNEKPHTRYSLHFVVSGAGYYTLGEKTYYIKKGQIFANFPNVDIFYTTDKTHPWKYYWLNFIGPRSAQLLSDIGLTPESPVIDAGDAFKKIEKLYIANLKKCQENPDNTEIISLYHLLNIYSILHSEKNVSPPTIQKTESYAKKAVEYIRNNYANPALNLHVVAQALNINDSYLSRLFCNEIGVNFVHYLAQTRIQAAINLIDNGMYVVCQVSESVGFTDPYYFSKVFKRFNAISPREQIKKIKKLKSSK